MLVFTYILPERSSIYTNGEDGVQILNNKLTSIVSDNSDVMCVVAGDLHARVKDLQDFIPDDNIDHV